MHPTAEKYFNKSYPEQRSDDWFKMRNTMLTASDAGTALGVNPYQTPEKLILSKCGVKEPFNDFATKHGEKYEDEARRLYEEKTGEKVFEIGLEQHPTEKWIGGSPDGITHSARLLEIKCPLKRNIGDGYPPIWYVAQVQVLMEVLDLEVCDFVQYKPSEITFPKSPEYSCVEIKRDREWWSKNAPVMKAFWDRVLHYRSNGHQELLPSTSNLKELTEKFSEIQKQVQDFEKMLRDFVKSQSDMKSGKWSKDDENWLENNKDKSMDEMENYLKRTPKAITARLEKMKKETVETKWEIVEVSVDGEDDI